MNELNDVERKYIQTTLMEQETKPISHIYFDLMCLKDFKLGALLYEIIQNKDMELYRYVISNIENYNTRVDRELFKYFPKLPYNEEVVLKRLNDPVLTNQIYSISPSTACYENIHRILYAIKKHNDHTAKNYPLRIVFNIYPFKLTDYIKTTLSTVLKMSTNFKLSIMEKPLKEVSPTTLYDVTRGGLIFKLLFIWDIWDIFSDDSNLKVPFTSNFILNDAYIYSPKMVQLPTDKSNNEKEIIENFNMLENYLNLCCNFKYLDFPIVSNIST